jgi:Ca2+-binding RTX toxin-like protein
MSLIAGVTQITSGVTYALTSADNIFVLNGANVVSTGSSAIVSLSSSAVAFVAGSVSAQFSGLSFGNNAATDHVMRVDIFSTGSVTGLFSGVQLYGYSARLVNQGIISGYDGVILRAELSGGSQSHINNSGTILGLEAAVLVVGSERRILHNSGTLDGGLFAYDSRDAGVDKLYNSGKMYGDVSLGAGDDTFDSLGGWVFGTVFGGAGSDYFAAGASIDNFDGGANSDTVRFDLGGAVRVALDRSVPNTGWAAGDTYTGIENIYGSNLGSDILIGDGQNNYFLGGGGNDILSTGLGNDRLGGGQGIDRLVGGLGSDAFQYVSANDGGDVIVDFSNAAGNDDYFFIYSALFGGGLTPGVLAAGAFLSSVGNVGIDADDRFILRTGDKTVWFDIDGAGGAAPVLIADLQATATVTASDFILF